MIDVVMTARETTPATVAVDVTLTNPSGEGIDLVQVFDRFDVLVHEDGFGCPSPSEATLNVPPLPTVRFPLHVLATDCSGEVTESRPFALQTHDTPEPGIHVPCSPLVCTDTSACVGARGRAVSARNAAVDRCRDAQQLREARDSLERWVAAMLTMWISLSIAAAAAESLPFLGGIVAAVFLAIAVVALVAAMSGRRDLNRVREQLRRARRMLDQALRDLRGAVSDVGRVCCPECVFEDLSEPACDI